MSVILIIDDDRALCRSLEIQLRGAGHEVRSAHTGAEGMRLLEKDRPDLVLLDLGLPDMHGLEVQERLGKEAPGVSLVIVTGQQDMHSAIQAMRAGAFDYIRKPFDLDEVLLALEKIQRFRTAAKKGAKEVGEGEEGTAGRREIVGAHPRILEVVKQIGLLSRDRVTVLVEGESGTGKELVARALHEASAPGKPFVAINCSAVVSTLPESEFFGYEKGAFTGADARKRGKLEFAGEGTVFLDEIGDMSMELQAKLLRVLQERTFERVGGLESLPFQARVVAATNRDLEQAMTEGRFREDLFFRLAVARIRIPPLRERRSDIPLLVDHFLGRIGRTLHRRVRAVEEEALQVLAAYDWPGNVRELENVLTRALVLSRDPAVLTVEEVRRALGGGVEPSSDPGTVVPLHQVERNHVERALSAFGWNITRTARALEISPTTLRKKIKDYGLTPPP